MVLARAPWAKMVNPIKAIKRVVYMIDLQKFLPNHPVVGLA
jgi:hypothetical protein